MFVNVTGKVGKMRKAKRFVIYPRKSADERVQVQADGCIGIFDPETGKGFFNPKSQYGVIGPHTIEVQFPPEFVEGAKKAHEVYSAGSKAIGEKPGVIPLFGGTFEVETL